MFRFTLCFNRISSVFAAWRCRFDPQAWTVGQGSSIATAILAQITTMAQIWSLVLELHMPQGRRKRKKKKKKKRYTQRCPNSFSYSGTLFLPINFGLLIRVLISLVSGLFILLVFLFAKIIDICFLIPWFFFTQRVKYYTSSFARCYFSLKDTYPGVAIAAQQ